MESTIRIRKGKQDEERKRRLLIKSVNNCDEWNIEMNPTDCTADADLSDDCKSVELVKSKKVKLNTTDDKVAMILAQLREETSQQHNSLTNAKSIEQTIQTVKDIRRLLSDQKAPIGTLLAHGLLPYLTSLLRNNRDNTLLYETIWCFINISSSSVPSHVEAVACSGAVFDISNLLVHQNSGVCEQAIWFTANIAGENAQYRDGLMAMTSVTDALLHHMDYPANISLLSTCAWAITNLFRGQTSNIIPFAIRFVPSIVSKTTVGVKGRVPAPELVDLMNALRSITECCTESSTIVLENGLLPVLIDAILYYQSLPNTTMLLLPIVRMILQFSAGTEQQTEQVIASGFLDVALQLLQSGKKNIQPDVLFAMSNIAAGSHDQIEKLIKQRKLMKVIVRLATDGAAEAKKQALWTMCNIVTQGSMKHANTMVHHECIAIFCNFLATSHDSQLILVVLGAVEKLLIQNKESELGYIEFFEHCNGVQVIEDLQSNKNEKVYDVAVRIIVKFFGGVEDDETCDEDQNIAPLESEKKTTFEFGTSINALPAKQLFPENVEMTIDGASTPMYSFGGTMMTNFR